MSAPLDSEQFRAHAHRVVDFLADYYRDIESRPVRSQVKPGYLRSLLPETAPEDAESLETILSDVSQQILPGVTHWQSPNFFAYFPSNSSTAGFLGEMLSGALNVVGFSWVGSPAATELEMAVMDWMVELMDLPREFSFRKSGGLGGGVIQGTASEAVLVALLAARAKKAADVAGSATSAGSLADRLAVYASDQAHFCVQKACMIAGIAPGNFRVLPTDASSNWALRPDVLSKAIEEDKKKGLIPFYLCATIGTTSSTAVDNISELGPIAKSHGLWLHVDAAYAGSAAVCPELRGCFQGLQLADSYGFNPHKWMLTNFDCSCMWVKESKFLKNALSLSPEYLRNKATEANIVVDYKDWQVPLGRRFRAVKLWLVLRMHGRAGLQRHIRRHVALAQRLEAAVRADNRFQIIAPRTFSLVCFRLIPPPGDTDNGKLLNETLLEQINNEGKIFFTHTVMSGVLTLRIAIGATKTEEEHVDAAWSLIQSHATLLLENWKTI